MGYIEYMKPISWDHEKNERLKTERSVSFEDVLFHILSGDIVDTIDHPNQQQYPGQQIHVIVIEEYAYLVPFVESEEVVFLRTIIPRRKATKINLGDE